MLGARFHSPYYSLKLGSLTEPGARLLTAKHCHSHCPLTTNSPALGSQKQVQPCPFFTWVGTGDLNWGPHTACFH